MPSKRPSQPGRCPCRAPWACLPGARRRGGSGRTIGAGAALGVVLVLALVAAPRATLAGPLVRFVDRTLAEGRDTRDSLAAGFNPAQLPLIAAALAADPHPDEVAPGRLYQALTRWHFWTGRRWDRSQSGMWSVDPRTLPIGVAQRGQVVAAHAALELIQLAALARMATENGEAYDALVWWTDHNRLRSRLDARLHDPLRGGYCDLDSLGAPLDRQDLDVLLPIAAGADVIPELARLGAWQLLTGQAPEFSVDAQMRSQAIERVDALHGWTTAPGLRLFEPAVTASLLHAGVRALADPALDLLVRDALGSVGLAPQDSVTLRLGAWTPRLTLADLAVRPFDRARAGVLFLDRAGVLTIAEADSLHALLRDTDTAEGVQRALAVLTGSLGRWRALDAKEERFLWENRRIGRKPITGPAAAFRTQEGDLGLWVGRAVDAITEDIIAQHLRRNERAPWRASVEPAVAGRGDFVQLRLRPVGRDPVPFETKANVRALWTNGLRLLSPRTLVLESDGEGGARADLGPAPSEVGIWRLVLEDLPSSVRAPAAVAVVEPLQMRVSAIERRGKVAHVQVEVISQVASTTSGRIEVQPPLTFDVAPSTSLDFALEGGTSQTWELDFTPGSSDGPALYPVRWLLFDRSRQISAIEEMVAVPFQWLRLGPLPPRGATALEGRHPPDEQLELARRFEGVAHSVGWNRMPNSRVSADGWVRLASAEDPQAVHYAFTAFTTSSREAYVRLEAEGPALLRVNGRDVLRTPDWGGQDRGEVRFGAGTNHLQVKIVGGGGLPARFRLDVRDIDGEPLRGISNALDLLLDQMAYLARTNEGDAAELEVGRESLRLVPFTYENPSATSVSVVGSFNGWSPTATRLVRLEDGRWQAKVRLRPGRFEYKFAVDGDQWIADPANPDASDDGFGGRNSVLVVE